jgi:glyoxylase-like metal-dependent hydrolase (beta-lactamase superfamily II)
MTQQPDSASISSDSGAASPEDDVALAEVFITRKCCGSGLCRNIAPSIFGEVRRDAAETPGLGLIEGSWESGAFTGVISQPRTWQELDAARTAAAGCGFNAIKVGKPRVTRDGAQRSPIWNDWPRQVDDGVWALGQPSTSNYGAFAYFIEHPDGNVLVDLPRPNDELFAWLDAHGGVRWIFLTHKDHVQHHAEYAARFPEAQRILGRADVNRWQTPFTDKTTDVEITIAADLGPCTLDGSQIEPSTMGKHPLVVLPQPGHTPGGLCLLYEQQVLFTGDHLAYSHLNGHLIAHRLQCWQDWQRQTDSIDQLARWANEGHLRFRWVLPGHGEWVRFDGPADAAATAAQLGRAVEWMRAQPPGNVPLPRWIPFAKSRAKPTSRFARLVMALGGPTRDAWLLPRSARRYLTDYEPGRGRARLRVIAGLAVGVLSTIALLAWIIIHSA